ncbi:MAG: DUF1116 domain-containing protein [Erysipelotrichia bacterium]|nr:DUF1116 domain-containing protein [Erysipelotrichia bacterium]
MKANELINNEVNVINIGLKSFTEGIKKENGKVLDTDWLPPASGDTKMVDLLFKCELHAEEINKANEKAVNIIMSGQPVLKGIKQAKYVVPGLKERLILHAGPPVEYKDMCGPMQGAVVGAMIYEGWAKDKADAEKQIANGEIEFDCNHHHSAVGPMTGIITSSMPVFEVVNETYGNYAYCTINEGIGEVMRFGANGPKVISKLHWLEDVFAPALNEAIQKTGGVNLKNIMAQALAMGDEMHQRNVAASLIFYKTICSELTEVIVDNPHGKEIVEFLVKKNDQFFLNLAMAASKSIMDKARNIPMSTVVTALSRNGVDFGLNVSSLGDEWFTAPCLKPVGLYFPGYSEEDANPDMGDSSITECIGIGGCAMGCSPAVVNFVGAGSVAKAMEYTDSMAEITVAQNYNLPMPNMNFVGVPCGFDIRKIVSSGILPVINTGMAHKKAGIGQVGAGIVNPPMDIFKQALKKFVEEYIDK